MVATIVKAILARTYWFSKRNLAFIQITISFPEKKTTQLAGGLFLCLKIEINL